MRVPIESRPSLLASLLMTLAAACSAGDTVAPLPPPGPLPLTGELFVLVVPTFEDLSVDVAITVEGEGVSVSKRATSVRLAGLAPGTYRVELALIGTSPANGECRIQEDPHRDAAVVAGATTTVVFGVYCPRTPRT
jgi:hypothetical protein